TRHMPPPMVVGLSCPRYEGAGRKPRPTVRGPTISLKENSSPGRITVPLSLLTAVLIFIFWLVDSSLVETVFDVSLSENGYVLAYTKNKMAGTQTISQSLPGTSGGTKPFIIRPPSRNLLASKHVSALYTCLPG